MKYRNIREILLIVSLLFTFNVNADLKPISGESMDAANKYFYATFAANVLNGGSILDEVISTFGVEPQVMDQTPLSDGIVQVGYIIPGDKLILITANKKPNNDLPFIINVSKYKSEIPFDEIIYRAFDSQTYDGRRIFYMGDKRQKSYKIRNILIYEKGPKETVTWSFVRTQ